MEKTILDLFNGLISLKDFSISFMSEFVYIIGILVGLAIFALPKRKLNTKKMSDFWTGFVLVFNSILLMYFYLKDINLFSGFNFTSFSNLFIIDENNTVIKILLNTFGIFFLFSTIKITKKFRFRAILLNSILLVILLLSFLLIQSTNYLVTYILLALIVFFAYKYASDSRIRKTEVYNPDFILISSCASLLFFLFYISTLFIKDTLQLNIIQVCASCAVLLKIGIFPMLNYSINIQNKNIPHSILLYCYVPLIGSIAFWQIIQNFLINTSIYQITLVCLLSVATYSFALSAFKQRNLIKFLIQTSYFYISYAILNFLFFPDSTAGLKLVFLYSFCALGIFSLISIIKINSKNEQININLIKGLYYKNKLLSYLLALILLIYTSAIPCEILLFNINVLKNIYIVDKTGIFLCFGFMVSNMLIMLNAFKIIQSIYSINLLQNLKFKKATILNYIVALIIIFFLLIAVFL